MLTEDVYVDGRRLCRWKTFMLTEDVYVDGRRLC